MKTRKASFAGSWYPADPEACGREIQAFIAAAGRKPERCNNPCGAIVPHAGWFFSGRIACECIYHLAAGPAPDVVAVFGVHMRPKQPPAIMTQGAWDTPLGALPVNETLAGAMARRMPGADTSLHGLPQDNTIELQLPFIKHFWPQTTIVPVATPPHPAAIQIGTMLAELAGETGATLRAVGSTDLTHYGPNYGFSPAGGGEAAFRWSRDKNDRAFIDAVLAMDPQRVIDEALANHNACCPGAAAAAIACGRAMGARMAAEVSYGSSHDKHRDSSFVGYSGIIF